MSAPTTKPADAGGVKSTDSGEAPTLPAWNLTAWGGRYWYVLCPHCREEHGHLGLGHREAKCKQPQSPYRDTGYVLVAASEQPVDVLPWRAAFEQRRSARDRAAAIRWLKQHGLR